LNQGQLVVFREVFPDKLILLAAGGNIRHGHDVLQGKRWQGLIDACQECHALPIPHWPHDIPENTPPEGLMLYIEDPKSYYRFSSGRHLVLFIIATKFTLLYQQPIVDFSGYV
jgi:hypothetical protein